ncbi:MAG: FKBP-type peptidyl-prolyl cis-trans isomerase SlyD [Candidatus Anoxychlamydiales bacterium]|nr:FKBP-type peptidyl-prolyl cis-trans isomerase SlyD [Candidatus Anoxychlamydiales bacterium]
MPDEAKLGDTVKLHYKAKTEDLIIFDSATQMDPLVFTIGDGQILPAFEDALIGMKAGDEKTINLLSDDAFGPYAEELITTVDKSQLPPNLEIEKDQQLQIQQPDGQVILVKVVDISDSCITFDANHPLAGKDITFDIQLLEIV